MLPCLSWFGSLLVREKIVAAVCHAGWVLISAGNSERQEGYLRCLDQRRYGKCRCHLCGPEVVREGNLITSRSPDDLPAFCREIISALK